MSGKSVFKLFLLVHLLLSLPVNTNAQGPTVIAKVDRRLWLEPINTETGFDKASRAAILVYALSLEAMKSLSDGDMRAAFRIKSLNRKSVNKWLEKELKLSLQNYKWAARNCPAEDWTCVGAVSSPEELLARAQTVPIPAALGIWEANLKQFVKAYISEQLRLAALFPKTSSEIDLFNVNEWNGDTLGDRNFFLTFDDGPTAVAGNTDGVLEMLAAHKKTGVFFVLGENFQNRLKNTNAAKLAGIYQGQCVALHGWQHLSHAVWPLWQSSITRSQELLKTTFANMPGYLPLFRPPYGQRTAESGAFFQKQGLQVALWNLDSQDWNTKVDPGDIINRMLTLMLIKRHGILLFHDIHPKAKIALPVIFAELGDAVAWGKCLEIADL